MGRRAAAEVAALTSRLRGVNRHSARIIYYHRIDAEEHRSCVAPSAFAEQMELLLSEGWQPIGLDSLRRTFAGGHRIPERSVAVTFDDGFADNYTRAFPILTRLSIPATIFLTAGFIGGEELPVLRDRSGVPPLNWEQVDEMARHGVDFGAHTLSHADLPATDDLALEAEITGSRRLIEEHLGRRITGFCYPRGRFDDRVVAAVKRAGFGWACTTRPGAVGATTDLFELPRTFIARDDSLADFRLKLAGGFDFLHTLRQARVAPAVVR